MELFLKLPTMFVIILFHEEIAFGKKLFLYLSVQVVFSSKILGLTLGIFSKVSGVNFCLRYAGVKLFLILKS